VGYTLGYSLGRRPYFDNTLILGLYPTLNIYRLQGNRSGWGRGERILHVVWRRDIYKCEVPYKFTRNFLKVILHPSIFKTI